MIPARFAAIVFGFILSGLMSCLVSAIATARVSGVDHMFVQHWMAAWLPSWTVAFPAVLIVTPITRRLVARLIRAE